MQAIYANAMFSSKEFSMSLSLILRVVLVLFFVGVLPTCGHSRTWGYGPSGGIGLIVIALIILLLMGRM
jgi:Sec-independent protein translocase protein TatA